MAETEGFEPSIHLSMYDDLANRCLQPLGHISANQERSIPIEGQLSHCKNLASKAVSAIQRLDRYLFSLLYGQDA